MFNFSANHLFLLSRTEYLLCAVFVLQDLDTQRVCRLHAFRQTVSQNPRRTIRPHFDACYLFAGEVVLKTDSLLKEEGAITVLRIAGLRGIVLREGGNLPTPKGGWKLSSFRAAVETD